MCPSLAGVWIVLEKHRELVVNVITCPQLQQAAPAEGGAGAEAAAPAANRGERADISLAVCATVRRVEQRSEKTPHRGDYKVFSDPI